MFVKICNIDWHVTYLLITMSIEPAEKLFFFFTKYGWLVYLIVIINERWGLPILTNLVMSNNQLEFYLGGVIVTALALGAPATIIGITGYTKSSLILWPIIFAYLWLAMH